jgi:hypothetical protein
VLLLLAALLVMASCQKETEEVVVETVEQKEPRVGFRDRHVLYIAWDGHRPKTDCTSGFGMCNVVSCVFCCVVNGVIVDCDDDPDARISNAGAITEANSVYVLTFELNPDTPQHQDAIVNQSIFYVDHDFLVDGYVIKEGEYDYDATIGLHGGYLVEVEAI